MFDQLHKYSVPMFIFSAGVGDVLEEIIRQANVFYPNVNVVSNYMDFDDSVSVQSPQGEGGCVGAEGCSTITVHQYWDLGSAQCWP